MPPECNRAAGHLPFIAVLSQHIGGDSEAWQGNAARPTRGAGCDAVRSKAVRDGGRAPAGYDFLWENAGKWPSSG